MSNVRGIIFLYFVLQFHLNLFAKNVTKSKYSDPAIIMQPQNCELNCLISTLNKPGKILNNEINLGIDSVVFLENEKLLTLLKGNVLASKKDQVIKTEYGTVLILNAGTEVLVVRQKNKIEISVLKGLVEISKRRSEVGATQLREGMSVWIGPITTAGYSAEGIPQAIKLNNIQRDLKNTLTQTVYDQRIKDIRRDQSRWIASASEVYTEVITQMELQKSAERAAHMVEQKRDQEKRNQARRLFRQKHLPQSVDFGPE
jgi:hypothetical protein